MMNMRTMKKSWVTIPPWMVIGAVIILAPIFIFWASQSIHKQRQNATRLLVEKGAALIRSFEAGTRTGMMGMRWGGHQVQRLLTETAQQSDIVYLMITDQDGKILAHNDPSQIGKFHGTEVNIQNVTRTKNVRWRQIPDSEGNNIFEVFRQFSPTRRRPPMHFEMMGRDDWFRSRMVWRENMPDFRLAIFVGLDMEAVDIAMREDIRHTVVMTLILLLIGFAGVISLFLAQGYRAARTSLSRVKAFSDSLVENMPIGLLAIDTENTITSANQAAESILQRSTREIIGHKIDGILTPEIQELARKLRTDSGVLEKEIDYPRSDGKRIPLEIMGTVLEEEDGSLLGYVILFRDLTEIQRLRKEIERTQRLASLGRLAAGIAHEIRNPLSSIKGFATYFRDRYRDVPEDQKTADIMIHEVERLNRVIGQLLEFARPMNIQLKPTSLQPLVKHTMKMIENQAREKNIEIKTTFSDHVDEVMIDTDRMSQVFLNLYLNAIEAMEEGGTLFIGLTHLDSGETKIVISDTGKGIAPPDHSRIFDPYFTTKPSGTGLGLAIVHRIVEAHKGEIVVESRQGTGTVVSIILPTNGTLAGGNNEV